jgi:hypothetical protein
VAKYRVGIFLLCLGGEAELSMKKPMWEWGASAATVWKARHCNALKKLGAS